ncbi:MAG: hypothetical protein ABEJ06_00635 [Haloarculaceae archaeon]
MDDYVPDRSFDPGSVPDDERCQACGASVPRDGEREYRHRFVLEDHSGSTEAATHGRLCGRCWWKLYDFVEGAGSGLDRP